MATVVAATAIAAGPRAVEACDATDQQVISEWQTNYNGFRSAPWAARAYQQALANCPSPQPVEPVPQPAPLPAPPPPPPAPLPSPGPNSDQGQQQNFQPPAVDLSANCGLHGSGGVCTSIDDLSDYLDLLNGGGTANFLPVAQ